MTVAKNQSRRLYYIAALIIIVCLAIGGALYYHHYEYQALSFNFPDGSSASISRHNLNQMTASQKQTFLHPINENALHPCVGNTMDQCIATPAADFWPVGSEGASNPYLKMTQSKPNEIMGRIVGGANNLQLKTTSGRFISVLYPLDPVANFNAKESTNYKFIVTAGDEIYVSYSGSMTQENTINTDQITSSSIILKGGTKTSMVKY